MKERSIADLRSEYSQRALRKTDLAPDPFRQFGLWFAEALEAEVPEVNAMCLATAAADSTPSARIVLLKGFDTEGFTFFTNYQSRKGQQLAENPKAALVFFWQPLERQVCIQGSVTKVTRSVSEAYFHSRPVGSQLGAVISHQSETVRGRAELERRLQEASEKYAHDIIPVPDEWGGFLLQPTEVEFWQGRPNRLHDRLVYLKEGENWRIERRFP